MHALLRTAAQHWRLQVLCCAQSHSMQAQAGSACRISAMSMRQPMHPLAPALEMQHCVTVGLYGMLFAQAVLTAGRLQLGSCVVHSSTQTWVFWIR